MIQTIFGSSIDLPSLILRLAIGTLFIVHGYPKLTPKQRQQGGAWMKNLGMARAMVPFGGFVEFFGGLALLLGFLTPIVALLSSLWMLSTTWFSISKLKKRYQGGYELDIVVSLAALALALLGSGIYSIDHLLGL
ncbi:MAG TPA: DoxX family membrane protein [Candidatus Bathyarchaeia archaeon]|nr:DoxX family membrane protein [Candidatus Bathyarchaeia archaeon]